MGGPLAPLGGIETVRTGYGSRRDDQSATSSPQIQIPKVEVACPTRA